MELSVRQTDLTTVRINSHSFKWRLFRLNQSIPAQNMTPWHMDYFELEGN